jgi:anaerobic magnesium-protoporphyrin IX monomethyl ester cyclase
VSLYDSPPKYSVISASRGCPYNCAHCAQQKLNGRGVRHRQPEDVVEEILEKQRIFGISKFAFYEDNILIDCKSNFERILDLLLEKNVKLHLSAPEGFEIRLLYPSLLQKMKKAGFRSIYLPLEIASFDGSSNLDQKRGS